jgi:hypothetical protein
VEETSQPDFGPPIDPRQIARIEGTHRGYMYQHAYAAACILAIQGTDAVVAVENDEDVEVLWRDRRVYVQVKVRNPAPARADVAKIVARFDAYRGQHTDGARSGTPVFVIATNAAPRLDEAAVAALPSDVHLSYPGHHDVAGIPEPQADITSALAALEVEAAKIELAAISPASLALKLVGYASSLATGAENHRIAGTKVASICDLIVEQLQTFPAPPSPYRPQRDEPEIDEGDRVRLIAGFSGAGKTAWASRKSAATTRPLAYFDVTGIPDPNLPSSIARELAARFIDDPAQRSTVMGHQAGMDLLRSIARRVVVAESGAPTIVLDNAHLIEPSFLSTVVRALEPIRVVLLMQPATRLPVIESSLSVTAEQLLGWDDHTIALEFSESGARADIATVGRIRRMTGALPLFVSAAAQLAARSFDGEPAAMCDALETGTTVERSTQDVLLETFVQSLSGDEQDALAVLGISEVALTRAEAIELVRNRLADDAKAAAALRGLSSLHVLQTVGGGLVHVHEAFRPFALAKVALLGGDAAMAARIVLRDILVRGFKHSANVERLRFWMSLSAQTGDIETLTDVAMDEMIHQIGGPDIVRSTLEKALDANELDTSLRFDVLDALAFWDAQRGDGSKTAGFVARMEATANEIVMTPRQRASLASKQMFLAAAAQDRPSLDAAFERGMLAAPNDVDATRNLRYNRAQGLVRMGAVKEGAAAANELADEYLRGFGLTQSAIQFRQPAELAQRIADYESRDVDLRHAADATHVVALTLRGPARAMKLVQAIKLYVMAGALVSVVRASQDAVDAFLEYNDPVGARFMMEKHVLPDLRRSGLVDHIVDVQAQYAVVLAYAGAVDEARAVMASLRVYEVDSTMHAQLAHQRGLIEKIARTALPTGDGQPRVRQMEKVGRNDQCPCGSGKKYKRCHGA